MSLTADDLTVDNLRWWRDKQLVKGHFANASDTQEWIDERLDEPDETAALSAGRSERLHEPIDDLDELRERRDDAEEWGFPKLAEDYADRIDELEEDRKSDAALEEETRAALGAPDDKVLEQTEAALSADDVVEAAERGQAPPQYIFDAYGIDPRDPTGGAPCATLTFQRAAALHKVRARPTGRPTTSSAVSPEVTAGRSPRRAPSVSAGLSAS